MEDILCCMDDLINDVCRGWENADNSPTQTVPSAQNGTEEQGREANEKIDSSRTDETGECYLH